MSIIIRPENPWEIDQITHVNNVAFGQPDEGLLVESLRNGDNYIPELSLVAEKDDGIIGHILFSPIVIKSGSVIYPSLALAPMAVLPEHQNTGIGTLLTESGLTAARNLGHQTVIVLGHSDFYPKFGFAPAVQFNIKSPYPVPEEVFMAIALVEGALDNIQGTVEYPKEFDQSAE